MTPKVWFVADASSACGRSLAEEAIRRGESVVAAAPDPRSLDSLVGLAPERVQVLPLDVSQEADVQPAIDAALRRFGRIDVLVGYACLRIVAGAGADALRATMETMFNPAKAARAIADAVAAGDPSLSTPLGEGAARSVRDRLAHLGATEMVASITGF
jgi:NAD(P)-dependent dehydrogenase (short-subunit alcohol dehydrogenase family)